MIRAIGAIVAIVWGTLIGTIVVGTNMTLGYFFGISDQWVSDNQGWFIWLLAFGSLIGWNAKGSGWE